MSPERYSGSESAVHLNFANIHRDLDAQLHTFTGMETREVCAVLQREPSPVSVELCATYLKAALIERGIELTPGQRNHAAAGVLQSYPHEYLEGQRLKSPKQYCKEHSLDGTVRSNLKTVFEATVSASKASLADGFSDGEFEDCGLGISDDELAEHVDHYLIQRAENVRQQVKKLKTVFPEDTEAYSENGHLLHVVGLLPPVVAPPETAREIAEIESALFKLKHVLEKYSEEDETSIAKTLCKALEPRLTERLSNHFRGIHEELAYEQASQLIGEIVEAYDAAVHGGKAHEAPVSLAQIVSQANPAAFPEEEPDDTLEYESRGETPDIEIMDLGSIALDLCWAEAQTFDASLMRQNGNSLVFLSALSPRAVTISQHLRQQAPDADAFDRLWEQACRIELTNTSSTHAYINKVKNVTRQGLKDHVVLRYGNTQHNARRIYYTKTTTDRYPELQELLVAKDFEPGQPLLLLVGETDKANQIRLYGDFGISRPMAKASNVGSV